MNLTNLLMIGMLNSNHTCLLAALLLVGVPSVSRADELALDGDSRLTGSVRSINGDGVVELLSDLSPEPVMLRASSVRNVEFDSPGQRMDLPEGIVELSNGDLLPARIKTFDGGILSVSTTDAGPMDIRREWAKSIQLGVQRQKAIYSGPRDLEEWTKDVEGARNWRFNEGTLASSGPAVAMRKIDVPSRFVFKFKLKWRLNPSFTIYFADPLAKGAEKVDRYLLQFSSAGMEVKRESRTPQKIQTVILLTRDPDEFANREVEVELRVDRKNSRIHLLLDGEPEASGLDPQADPPTGSGFVFISSTPAGSSQEISGIQVLDFDDSRERHHSEDRGDPELDSIISRDDDRWGGHLTGIRQAKDGAVLTFKSDFQEEPLELLESDVSTIFLAKPDSEIVPEPDSSWLLKLTGGGSLHVASCEFSEDEVRAIHPLLGNVTIRRSGIVALEQLAKEVDEEETK
jgi:hypothetical protein